MIQRLMYHSINYNKSITIIIRIRNNIYIILNDSETYVLQ